MVVNALFESEGDASREVQARKAIELLKKTNKLIAKDPPDLRSARAEFQATVNGDPKNVEIRRAFACFLFGAGQKEDSKAQFERALALDPISSEVICSFSELLVTGSSDYEHGPSKEDLSQAQSLLNRCLQSHPEHKKASEILQSMPSKEYDVGVLSPRENDSPLPTGTATPPPEEKKAAILPPSRGLQVTERGLEQRKEQDGAGVSANPPEERPGDDSDDSADEALGRLGGKDGKKKKRFFFCMPVPGL